MAALAVNDVRSHVIQERVFSLQSVDRLREPVQRLFAGNVRF
jgi:hypothetical protein